MKKKPITLLVISALLSVTQVAFSKETLLPISKALPKSYYQIDSVKIERVDKEDEFKSSLDSDSLSLTDELFGIEVIGEMAKFGKGLWDIIKEGKMVVSTHFETIHLLPFVEGREIPLRDLYGWSNVERTTYNLTCKNLLGMETVNYSFAVTYRHHGQHKNPGYYLSGVDIVPLSINVKWGHTFNASARVKEFLNRGTKDFPLAHIALEHRYSVETALSLTSGKQVFEITADGKLQKISM